MDEGLPVSADDFKPAKCGEMPLLYKWAIGRMRGFAVWTGVPRVNW